LPELPELNPDRIPELGGVGTNIRNSGIGWNWNQFPESRELGGDGIARNSWEFRAIPCNSLSTQFPEFRTGITYLTQRLIFSHNSMREGKGVN